MAHNRLDDVQPVYNQGLNFEFSVKLTKASKIFYNIFQFIDIKNLI